MGAVGDFFEQKLRIPAENLRDKDIAEIRRLHPKPRRARGEANSNDSQIREEVLVVFKEVQTRDMIFRHTFNLSDCRVGRHPNSIGIRIHIPTHLLGVFNT